VTYRRMNLKAVGLSVNLSPVVIRHLKGDRKIFSQDRS